MHRSVLAALVLTILGPALLAQSPPVSSPPGSTGSPPLDGSFVEQIEVLAVELMVDVRDRKGVVPDDLTPDDFEILEDGRPMQILGLDPPAPPAGWSRDGALLPEEKLRPVAGEVRMPWRFLVYVDAPLTSYSSIRRSAKALAGMVPDLVARGAVEIVVADPVPRVTQSFTRDPERLRYAFEDLDRSVRSANHVGRIRRQFVQLRDMSYVDFALAPGPLEADAGGRGMPASVRDRAIAVAQLRAAANEEYQVIRRQMAVFAEWMASYGPAPASAVVLLNDGFDIEPVEFYTSVVELAETEGTSNIDLWSDFNHYRLTEEIQATTRLVAAQGWTSLILASRGAIHNDLASDVSLGQRNRARSILGGEAISGGPQLAANSSVLRDPLEPLQMAADDTGGEVLTSLKKASRALDRLDERYRLTYLAERGADGEAHRLDVRLKRPGLRLRAPNWIRSPSPTQVAAARVRRMLIVDAGGGEVPVDAQVTRVEAVERSSRKNVELDILFDLAPFREALPREAVPVRFTVGVALIRERPFLYQLTESVPVPDWTSFADDEAPVFSYKIGLDVPSDAWRIAVVVEEPKSGLWGGAVARTSGTPAMTRRTLASTSP